MVESPVESQVDSEVETSVVATVALSSGVVRFAAVVVAAFALIAALYLARGFFVPLLIGVLASYALHPPVNWLERHRLPRSVGAAIILAMVVGSLSWVSYSISDDAAIVIEKLPDAARKIRKELSSARSSTPTVLQNMQEAAHEIQGAAADAGAHTASGAKAGPRPKSSSAGLAIRPPDPRWLSDYTLAQSALLATVIGHIPSVLLLTYFLLASGDHFRRKLIRLVGPLLAKKKHMVRLLEEIDSQIQRYLLTTFATNTLLAVCAWLAYWALDLEHAGFWGVAAGVLHFIPYLGPAILVLGSGLAAFLQSGSLLYALAVAAVSLLIVVSIGMVFLTWLQSRFARVNPAVLFIGLLFFSWLWGVWGLLLGAPLVAISKVICDRVEPLKPVGDLIGR